MRWHVHGTDAVTGEDLELAINEPEAQQAIKAAMDRHIVVSHVTADSAYTWKRMIKPLLVLVVIGLGATTTWLFAGKATLQAAFDQAVAKQNRMAQSVATVERAAADIRAQGNLADGASEQFKKLEQDLAAARSRMSLTERQLSMTHQQRNDLDAAAARLPEVEAQAANLNQQLATLLAAFNDREKQVAQLRGELEAQRKHLDQLSAESQAKQAALDTANGELEKLKEELLLAVAKANMPVMAEPTETAPASVTMPWALRVSYEAARSFMALHSDPPTITTRPGGLAGASSSSSETTSGVLTENAVRLRFIHDKEMGHVYTATMIVSVAAGAPKDRAAENLAMMGDFLKEFVPGIQDAGGIVSAAVGQAGNLSEERRALFLTQDCRVTAWTNKEGLLTLQVEAVKEAGE